MQTVDDLEDISKLEQCVGESAVMLLLLSKGYFISRNVAAKVELLHVDSRALRDQLLRADASALYPSLHSACVRCVRR